MSPRGHRTAAGSLLFVRARRITTQAISGGWTPLAAARTSPSRTPTTPPGDQARTSSATGRSRRGFDLPGIWQRELLVIVLAGAAALVSTADAGLQSRQSAPCAVTAAGKKTTGLAFDRNIGDVMLAPGGGKGLSTLLRQESDPNHDLLYFL